MASRRIEEVWELGCFDRLTWSFTVKRPVNDLSGNV